jgi:alpha-beta hydrolase superfamily lysophospholipase
MKTYESGWENKDGIKFYLCGWEPNKKPKAVVVLVHGHGEHVGRYTHVADAFTKVGYALVGFDLRGHGKSGGARGHAPSYEALMDDIADFLEQVIKRYPKLPIFIYGHSLGGNLVLNFILRRRPTVLGAIVTAPWLKLAFDPPAVQVSLARVISKIAPGFTQHSRLDTNALSQDTQIVEAYNNDPLVHDQISARLYVDMHDSGLWALEHATEIPIPLLLMHGTADRITSNQASREFAEQNREKVTWRTWEGCYHEIHNEPQKADVLKVMLDWMDARLKKK